MIQVVEPASEMELVMQDQHSVHSYAVQQNLMQQHQNYQMVMQQQMQIQQQQQQQQNSGNMLSVTDATGKILKNSNFEVRLG